MSQGATRWMRKIGMHATLCQPSVPCYIMSRRQGTCTRRRYSPRPAERARLWDGQAETLRAAGHAGAGPIGFRRDGTPVQLVTTEEGELLLGNLEKDIRICECWFADRVFTLASNDLNGKVLPLAPNGSLAAPAANGPQNTGTTAVWQTDSGKQLFQVPGKISALAFSVDGTLLAAGERDSQVTA